MYTFTFFLTCILFEQRCGELLQRILKLGKWVYKLTFLNMDNEGLPFHICILMTWSIHLQATPENGPINLGDECSSFPTIGLVEFF